MSGPIYNDNARVFENQIVIIDTTSASSTSGALMIEGGSYV